MNLEKICLIQMPSEATFFGSVGTKIPPLSLGIIAGYLRERGCNIDLFDLIPRMSEKFGIEDKEKFESVYDINAVYGYLEGNENAFFDEYVGRLLEDIKVEDYALVCISVGPHLSWGQTFSGLIFGEYIQRNYNKLLFFGGFNLTTMVNYRPVYDDLYKRWVKKFKYVNIGPGEETIYQFIKAIREDKGDEFIYSLNGMCYLNQDEELFINPPEKRRIVRPDYDGLRLEDYLNNIKVDAYEENMVALFRYSFAFTNQLNSPADSKDKFKKCMIIPYIFNYNCPYSCAFCVESDPESPKPIIGSVEQVINDLEQLSEKYNSPYFYFINNAINFSKNFIKEICQKIIEKGLNIYWSDCARFDNINYELLQLLYKAGCRKLVFGMESGSVGLVKRINKKIDLNYAEQVLQWCSEIGIWAELEIIAGIPTESEEEFEESFGYLKRNINNISFMTINRYIPMPGSVMYREHDRFNIQIHCRKKYEDIVKYDLELFRNNQNPVSCNNVMRVYSFTEINGKNEEEIYERTTLKMNRIKKLLDGRLMKEILRYIELGYINMKDLQGIREN